MSGTHPGSIRRVIVQRIRRLWRDVLREMVFVRFSPFRILFRVVLSAPLRRVGEGFDVPFYLAQIDRVRVRRHASRSPELHYLLLGSGQKLSPAPGFDPVYYRHRNPGVPRRRPFLHYARAGAAAGLRAAAPIASDPADQRPGALLIDHSRGGGSSHYLDIYAGRMAQEGYRVVRARRVGNRTPLFVIVTETGDRVAMLDAGIASLIADLGIRHLVINHLIDMPDGAFKWVPALAQQLGLSYEVLLHDYHLACPRECLIDRDGHYCGLAPTSTCVGCVADLGIDAFAWRSDAATLLASAERVTAPSADLAQRMQSQFPSVAIEVHEPETEIPLQPRPDTVTAASKRPIRVAIIGSLNHAKGYHVITDLARVVTTTRAAIEIVIMGETMGNTRLEKHGVRICGRYRDEDALATLTALSPDMVLFPAIWPETWSFTLSHALRWGGQIVAFDIGAIAARLRRLGRGMILPYEIHRHPEALLAALVTAHADFIETSVR